MKARKVKKLDPKKPLRENATRVLRTRLDELAALAADALEPGATPAQHDMRIAAKRLRYALEITGACFEPDAHPARRAARELQSVLGEIHDCDVMLPKAEGIDSLEALLRTRRELLFARFRDLWHSEAGEPAFAALEHSLSRRA
jgi:CHAD domain-containing protein